MTSIRYRALSIAFALGVLAIAGAQGQAQGQTQARPEAALRAAIETETVKGDLRAAIAQYRALAASPDRRVAAQALVRMAGCHRKLGDAEARAIYERVVRDFADQADAVAAARAGLRETPDATKTAARGDRAVWTGGYVDRLGRVSADGRYVTYVEETTGNLGLHDLATNTGRLLTSYAGAPWSEFAEYSTISADGSEVLYCWGAGRGDTQTRELRRLGLHGAAPKEPVRVYAGGPDVLFFGPLDWSNDKSLVATSVSRRDGTGQLVTIRVADGTLTVLRAVNWRGPDRVFLSPDARHLAYDLHVSDADARRDVFVMDLATRRETVVVRHAASDGVLGWSPDGRHLIFSSDRTGAPAIWVQALAGGEPQGLPRMLKPDGAGLSLGWSSSGTLYVHRTVSSRDVHLADLDLSAGTVGRVRGFTEGFVPSARVPSWSRDGQWLAHPACHEGDCVAIRSATTGAARLLRGELLFVRDPRWSPDGRQLLVASRDRQGRHGIFRIDVATGAVAPVVLGPRFGATPAWSADGTRIYYLNNGLIERTLSTGAERTLRPATGRAILEISPDGLWLAVMVPAGPPFTGPGRILIYSTSGSEMRELWNVEAPDGLGPARTIAWTGDSRAVLAIRTTPAGRTLWEVPIDGRPARRLAVDAAIFTQEAEGMLDQGFAVSPDGRTIAFLSGRTAYEVWAVEDLLAALH